MSGTGIFTVFGTEFEELEDEAKDSVSKRPTRVQDEIVTDEKGRRRFHGAFTGGFSAGYFNTVGTKEGWVPSTFKSSRSERAETSSDIRPEDYMDAEDLGEFGIAPRRITTKSEFVGGESEPDGEKRLKRQLAWERPQLAPETNKLAELIKPTSDSMGVRLLKQMGWRPGQGIGAKQSKTVLDRNKESEKVYGCQLPILSVGADDNATSAEEIEQMAPGFLFAPDDIEGHAYEPKNDLHGLGYTGINADMGVLKLKQTSSGFHAGAASKKKKGIHGQAFGVGAFEEDDEDIYSFDDLSNYDYTLGAPSTSDTTNKLEKTIIEDFAPASKPQQARRFYAAPRLPRDFRVGHVPAPFTADGVPKALLAFLIPSSSHSSGGGTASKHQTPLNAAQRAQIWDDGQLSVMSMLKSEDRQRLENLRAAAATEERTAKIKSETLAVQIDSDPFKHEPERRKRFNQYIDYLRRGLNLPQPFELTEWEWEKDVKLFQQHIPESLRSMVPEVYARGLPLAKPEIARPFAHLLSAKFTKSGDETAGDAHVAKGGTVDEEKSSAVKMKMFGQLTREKFIWYPDAQLCKRFNVSTPYPGSTTVGCPYFKKESRKAGGSVFDFGIGLDTLPNTAQELANRRRDDDFRSKQPPRPTSTITTGDDDALSSETTTQRSSASREYEATVPPTTNADELLKPPMDLFKAIFTESDNDENSGDEDEDTPVEIKKETPDSTMLSDRQLLGASLDRLHRPVLVDKVKFTPVMKPERREMKHEDEGVDSDVQVTAVVEEESYGPALPPPPSDDLGLPPYSVIEQHRKRSKRKEKKHKKHKKSHKSEKKDGKSRSKRKKKRSGGSSTSPLSVEELSSG